MARKAAIISPVGESAGDDRDRKLRENPEYRAEYEKYALARQVSLLLIGYRMEHNLTQKELAAVLEMTVAEVSRFEGGRHNPSGTTITRILGALKKRIVFISDETEHELVSA